MGQSSVDIGDHSLQNKVIYQKDTKSIEYIPDFSLAALL